MKTCLAMLLKTIIISKPFYINRRNPVVFTIIFLCCFLTLCNTSYCAQGEAQQSPVKQEISKAANLIPSKILPLAEILTNEKPSLEAVLNILGIQDIELRNNSIKVHGSGYTAFIDYEEYNKSRILNSVRIYIETLGDLSFKDLSTLLGTWVLVNEGPSSMVRFMHKNTLTNRMAVIYLQLFNPPRDPQSPVQMIMIRGHRTPKNIK